MKSTDAIVPDSSSLSRQRERAGVRGRARALRHGQTDAETRLWSKLRSRQIGGHKFRRQHPLGPYFSDFACLEIGLVVELDGGQHVGSAYDLKRSEAMQVLGFQTLRFWNNDVLLQTEAVLEKILHTADALALTLALSRQREREPEKSAPVPPISYLSRQRGREQDKSLPAPDPASVPSPVPRRGLG